MRVVIFGASGATGRRLMAQAVGRGYGVTAFVRDRSRLEALASDVQVVQGDVAVASSVARSVEGQDGVLCALGAATPLRRDATLVEGVRHIVRAMEDHGVPRLVYLSFLGVAAGRRQLSALGRYVVAPLLMRNVVADHEAKESVIQATPLDWIIVRPPRLTNGPRRGVYRAGLGIRAMSIVPRISRADLADFMLRQLVEDTYLHQAPAVMY
jgi:putative NADH-flavin reductase